MSKCKVCGAELEVYYCFCFHQCEKKLSDIHKLQYYYIRLCYNDHEIETYKLINTLTDIEKEELLLEIVYDKYGQIISFKHYP